MTVEIAPVADGTDIAERRVTGHEDKTVALGLAIAPRDTVVSDAIAAVIIGSVADGASLIGADARLLRGGSWSVDPAGIDELELAPPANFAGEIALWISVTRLEEGAEAHVTDRTMLRVTIAPDADAPIIRGTNATGGEDTAIASIWPPSWSTRMDRRPCPLSWPACPRALGCRPVASMAWMDGRCAPTNSRGYPDTASRLHGRN